MELKPGTRLRSVTDSTEVIVVRALNATIELRCGGHPMVSFDAEPAAELAVEPGFDEGCALGKRYVDGASGIEVLCTKPGPASLSAGTVLLLVKDAKPLPSSD
jgi:hypothetical protein